MLTFVGLGLYDERSITIEGKNAIADADYVVAEFYTSFLGGTTITELETFHNIYIDVRDRSGIEEHPNEFLDRATQENIVFVTAGDPMISTTHIDLRLRAHDRDIETRIIHGTSAQTAASGLTGLQNYRFGKAVTLPFPDAHSGRMVPPSVIETISDNQTRGLHTLVYLDIDAEQHTTMTASTGAELLSPEFGESIGVGVARAGSPDPVVNADLLKVLAEYEFGLTPHLLVIPAELHHIESEALNTFADAPQNLLDLD